MTDSEDDDKTRFQPNKGKPDNGTPRKQAPRQQSPRGKAGVSDKTIAADGRTQIRPPPTKSDDDSANTTVFQSTRIQSPPERPSSQRNDRTTMGAPAGGKPSNTKDPTRAVDHPTQHQSEPRGRGRRRLQVQDTLKNRFVLGRVLGAGGMGVVYKAKDLLKVEAKDRDPFVAIKVLGEEFKSHPEAFIALQRESRKTQKIAHPNIVNVHDFDKDGDTVFMTMEYLEGTPLDKLVKKHKNVGVPEEDAWEILDGICGALAYAHNQDIIHSDLKPGNIFVTHNNVSKVFDFGIARAVASAEQHEFDQNPEDKTLFDAGSLGALTPAYASLEMLEGDTPDVRDDIYALGCIAYELFTGKHPYQRRNAIEAKKQGLKPERINSISKQQWRAIEAALAFDRENRIESVHDLWQALSQEKASPLRFWPIALLVIASVSAVVYAVVLRPDEPVIFDQRSDEEVAKEAELRVRLEIAQNNLSRLLKSAVFDQRWQSELGRVVSEIGELAGLEDARYLQARTNSYQLYVLKIKSETEAQQYQQALDLIPNARRYRDSSEELDALHQSLTEAFAAAELQRKQALLAQQSKAEQEKASQQKQRAEVQRREARKLALANINEQLACDKILNMGDFGIAVKELRKIDPTYYRKSEKKIIQSLSKCISKIGRNFPTRAKNAQKAALRLFEHSAALRNIDIVAKDPCRTNLAGQGSRGSRSICQDLLKIGGRGPDLVVIPSTGVIAVFAIGKYEVTVEQINQFCNQTKTCKPLTGKSQKLPATGITYTLAKKYLAWMSKQTGKKYRLPTYTEWRHAAKSSGGSLDSNRNCKLDSRGIQKGGSLVNATIGQQNRWGVVNYVGNAQEWVHAQGGTLLAVGGSFNTEMEACSLAVKSKSSGQGDRETGFRVVRELGIKAK